MTDDDRDHFRQILFILAETFKEPISDLRLEGYWIGLRDLTLEQVRAAAALSIRDAKFFPRPSELRTAVLGNSIDRAEFAWQSWRQAAIKHGAYTSILFQDAALGKTLIALFDGWIGACSVELSPEMWTAKHKEFDRVYHIMRQRELCGPVHLLGLHEQHNREQVEWVPYTPFILLNGFESKQLSAGDVELLLEAPTESILMKRLES